ncbi:MAG: ribonuclease R [Betaproteobacteria bacterium]|jgi:ribonuclease R
MPGKTVTDRKTPDRKRAARLPTAARALRAADPYLGREQAKYANPLPSREYLLQLMTEEGLPVTAETLSYRLGIDPDEQEAFSRRLQAMAREGQILVNRRGALCVAQKLDLVAGTVQGHPEGYGFLVPDEAGSDMFLGSQEMAKVFHGDRVMARRSGVDRRGRMEGEIVEVLEHRTDSVVGRFLLEHGIGIVSPSDRRVIHDILVPADAAGSARAGQIVVVQVVQQPARYAKPIGRVVEVLGEATDPGMEIEIAVRKHQVPHEFPPDALREADAVPQSVGRKDLRGRTDLRDLPLVTIDGATARDFDDAVFCDAQGKGFKLYVAIADVSHYVRPGDALDREGAARGNSVYFPRRVIPMLPEALSNGICSLNPGVDRLCMCCEMEIGPRGDIARYAFYPAVMHSKARLTYDEVWSALSEPASEAAQRLDPLLQGLRTLERLYRTLAKARARRGAIDFETVETRMEFGEDGKIAAIHRVERNDAHRIIEECMLAANVCASDFLQSHEHPALYRVHEGPTEEKLARLREFLAEFGLQLGGGDAPKAKDYAKLLSSVRDRPDVELLQTVMLRSLRQAVYSPEPLGHFGLAYESYTHFTSPIRRYPDLIVHRAIRSVLAGKGRISGDLAEMGRHCSMTERRADEASRDVESWLKCYYMRDRVGEVFSGTVSGVASFGIFVALDTVYVEGMVHVSELGNDYFHFDASRHQMLGERSGQRYRLGDRLGVKLMRVDLERSRLDFVPA